MPRPDSTAPRNTLIWILTCRAPDVVEVRGPQGASLDLSPSFLQPGGDGDLVCPLLVLRPIEQLQPGEHVVNIKGDGGEVDTSWSFLVEDRIDLELPALPVVLDETAHHRRESTAFACRHEQHFVRLKLEPADEFSVVVARFEGEKDFVTAPPAGTVVDWTTADSFELGRVCETNWDDAAEGAVTHIELGRFDLAGNFSGWSDPRELEFGDAGCGCTERTETGASPGLLSWFLVPLCRRRRIGRPEDRVEPRKSKSNRHSRRRTAQLP